MRKFQNLLEPYLSANQNLALCAERVNLNHAFGEIESYGNISLL